MAVGQIGFASSSNLGAVNQMPPYLGIIFIERYQLICFRYIKLNVVICERLEIHRLVAGGSNQTRLDIGQIARSLICIQTTAFSKKGGEYLKVENKQLELTIILR
jgi:hypothetical protein